MSKKLPSEREAQGELSLLDSGEEFLLGDAFGRFGVVVFGSFGNEFIAVFVDHRFDGPGAGFTEGADGAAVDLVGDFFECLDILGSGLAACDAVGDLSSSTVDPSRHGVHWPQDSWA